MRGNKPLLIVVDSHEKQREHVVSALAPLYTVWHFAALPEALRQARRWSPDAMLVADDRLRESDLKLLTAMRAEPELAAVPVTVLASDDSCGYRADALGAGATACLAAPHTAGILINAVSAALNAAVEKRWERLPAVEAAALKASAAMFCEVAALIAADGAISYPAIRAACQPLITAIRSKNIRNILQAVREHDDYTFAHSLRVGVFLSMFGSGIGLSPEDQNVLTIGGLLHDLGKIRIPTLVLNKPGRLSDAEFDIMKGHVPATLQILERCKDVPRAALVIAGQHHERLDGSGYPNGLTAAQLNDLARMAGIADVFSALTDRRVYKSAIAPEPAFDIMRRDMHRHLDQQLLERFRQMLLDTRLA